MKYTVAKFLNGPLAGKERVLEDNRPVYVIQTPDLKAMLTEEKPDEIVSYETITYHPLPHIFVDQNYTYYTLERKHAHDSSTDSADITRHVSSD